MGLANNADGTGFKVAENVYVEVSHRKGIYLISFLFKGKLQKYIPFFIGFQV